MRESLSRSILLFSLSLMLLSLLTLPAKSGSVEATAQQQLLDNPAGQLDAEINSLSKRLATEKDLSASVSYIFLGDLTEQLSKASTRDIDIKLLPSRVMSSESDLGFAKYQNYLDLEGGQGALDIRKANLEQIYKGRIYMLVDIAGKLKTQARGKQIGINYNANPDVGVKIRDQIAFIIESSDRGFRLRPEAKQLLARLNIDVSVDLLGTTLNTSRDVPVDVAKMMKPIDLPSSVSSNYNLPRSQRRVQLSNMSYKAEDGKLGLEAELSFSDEK